MHSLCIILTHYMGEDTSNETMALKSLITNGVKFVLDRNYMCARVSMRASVQACVRQTINRVRAEWKVHVADEK